MAESVELSCGLQRRSGGIGGLISTLRHGLSRLASGRRGTRLEPDAWPDYLLRDIGLDRATRNGADPRALPMDWPLR